MFEQGLIFFIFGIEIRRKEMESFERDGSQNLSMREKSVLKRRINRAHNSNFRAGYIPINEDYLHKSGIRGRKRYVLYCAVLLLVILAILNALMTAGIVYLLKFTHVGMSTLEFIPDSGLVRFLGKTTIDTVDMVHCSLGGRTNQSLVIETNDGMNITVSSPVYDGKQKTESKDTISLRMNADDIIMESSSFEEFSIKNPSTKKTLLSTLGPVNWHMIEPGLNLHASQITTESVHSMPKKAKELVVESERSLTLMGMEGVNITSQTSYFHMTANQNVNLETEDGSLVFEGDKGISLSRNLPVPAKDGSQLDPTIPTYKLCVCMPSGKVYGVPMSSNCEDGADACS